AAIGGGMLAYQWFFNGTSMPGATSSSLTLSNVQAQQCGEYSVIIGNNYGFVASSKAVLTLASSDIIIDNPQAMVVGAWSAVSAPSQFGANCLFKPQGFGDSSVRYLTSIPRTGNYRVYEWHSAQANRSVSVPHQIIFANGSAMVSVNQA